MSRKIVIAVLALALVAVGCSRAPKGPQKYAIDVDAKSTAKEAFQFGAFFPAALSVSPGDSIKFRNGGSGAPHTITLGVTADRKNSPPVVTDKGENPVVFSPCFTPGAPTPKLLSCSNATLPAYDGTGYWNSGILQPKPAPKKDGPKNVTLKLAKTIPAGTYAFTCLLHPLMNGTITVVTDPGKRSKKADLRKQAKDGMAQARRRAQALSVPSLATTSKGVTAAAGWGDNVTSVNRFSPATIAVKAGQTVTWVDHSPYEPHTVTFGKVNPDAPDALAPAGPASGGDYTGGVASSSLFDATQKGGYSLRFPTAGTYAYICVIHPGMAGTVKVSG